MFQQRPIGKPLSQWTLLTCITENWRHFKEWRHYIVLNHSCDLEHKSEDIEYILLVEAQSVITEILTMLEVLYNPSVKAENNASLFSMGSCINQEWLLDIESFYEHLTLIYKRMILSMEIINVIKSLRSELDTAGYDLKTFLHFEYSSDSMKKFKNMFMQYEQYFDKYLRFLKKEHISQDTDYSSSKPSTFFLYLDQDKMAVPDLLEVNFLKTLPVETSEIKKLIEEWILECKIDLASPYRESFAKKFWDFFSRVALP